MPKKYSYSRISTFEQCPLKFKFKYIDQIKPEIEKSIEAHLGKSVHNTLEWLYSEIKNKKIPSIDETIVFYSQDWEKDYTPEKMIINSSPQNQFNKGITFLLQYYTENQPFDDNTLEVEKYITLELDEKGEYKIQGFIDRLTYNLATNEYEIHDYKTANSPPSRDKLKKDRQLALYAIAIKNAFGNEKEVSLIWHFLAHNQKIRIKTTNQELENTKHETLEIVKRIEASENFPPNKSKLCDWCEYKSICPAWENKPLKMESQESLDKYPAVKKYIKDYEENEKKNS